MTDKEIIAYEKGWNDALATLTVNIGNIKPVFTDNNDYRKGLFDMANGIQKIINEHKQKEF
jgi:hypothetical protein